jgi:hypothetical protein
MAGRPTVYSEAKAQRLLDAIASGSSLETACKLARLKVGTVACWAARDHPPGFRQRYFEAFGAKMIIEADRILEIVDGVAGSNSMPAVQAARTRADMRRWLAGKLLAEFGDRLHVDQVNHDVVVILPPKADALPAPLLEGQARLLDGPARNDQ